MWYAVINVVRCNLRVKGARDAPPNADKTQCLNSFYESPSNMESEEFELLGNFDVMGLLSKT